MKQDYPHYMISISELGEDHSQLKHKSRIPKLTNEELSQYYVYATFMPPGENKVIISYDDIENKESYNLLEGIIPIRKEEVSLF